MAESLLGRISEVAEQGEQTVFSEPLR